MTRIIICMEGGIVQAVYSNEPALVSLADHDEPEACAVGDIRDGVTAELNQLIEETKSLVEIGLCGPVKGGTK